MEKGGNQMHGSRGCGPLVQQTFRGEVVCIQKGMNRVRRDNDLDSPEGDQLVHQVMVNRVYRGDGEQLSHVEAVGIRLVQDARGNAWCGLRDLRRASSSQSGRLGFSAPGTENNMGPVFLTCLRSSLSVRTRVHPGCDCMSGSSAVR